MLNPGKNANPAVTVAGPASDTDKRHVLTPAALSFITELHHRFNDQRLSLLAARVSRTEALRAGELFDFLPATRSVREGAWQVGEPPADLRDRRVEITGPAEPKMMINALNCGAKAFMCDFEDSLSPTWANVLAGQHAVQAAVRRTLSFTNEAGKQYKLNPDIATLLLRPRGWHLPEKHLLVDGQPVAASFVDFGLSFFHNAKEQVARGSGPYYYLPKMESHREARLWNDVFLFAQAHLGLPSGTIKATVLIETIPAAFEMDEILYELREHITGLNAGRWDYLFSMIKKFALDPSRELPERAQLTMSVPFMRAYCELLVETCHKRGAHAMGGMAAFIPSRKDAEVNRAALAKVKEDKDREAKAGFDGTWIAHPDLLATAAASFDAVLGSEPNQKQRQRERVTVTAAELINPSVPGAKITRAGLQNNIAVALEYITQWLQGNGAVALHNLMEDAATAEIARAQLWQWVHLGSKMEDGQRVDADLYRTMCGEELVRLGATEHKAAATILDDLVLSAQFAEFLTLPAYELLVP